MKRIKIIIFILIVLFIGCKPINDDKCDGVNHTESEWIITTNATCTSSGTMHKICTKCGIEIATSVVKQLDHTIIIDEAVEADCTHTGLSEGSHCSICETVIEEQKILPMLGHDYILTDQITEEDGEYLVYSCTRCNDTYKVKIEEQNPCTNNHTESEWIITTNPTCTSEGSRHKICTVCNIELQVSLIPSLEHNIVIDEAIEADCTHTGLSEGSHCSLCNKIIKEQTVISALEHDYVLTNAISPTSTSEGYYEYVCSKCGNTYKEVIPILVDYNEEETTKIVLNNNSSFVTNDNGGVIINENEIIITLAGDYDITGTLDEGNIIIRLLEEAEANVSLQGVNITSKTTNPIYIESGDKVELSIKNGTQNFINDNREYVSTATGAAIYSCIDLEIKGKGELTINSTYNNGIGSKNDVTIKNLTLNVTAINNAIKGNDSITIESGNITAISTLGDALKTENSDISSKGNQRGTITIEDGTINLYAACDAIDASYDIVINGGTINAYTESFSPYSGEVTVTSNSLMYLSFTQRSSFPYNAYSYCALFTNDEGLEVWQNSSKVSSFRTIYYSFEKPEKAKYVTFYAYTSNQTLAQADLYAYKTDLLSLPTNNDAYSISRFNASSMLFSGSWTNYTTSQGGPGGFGPDEGNPNEAEYSCKGLKADNVITINNGTINIKSHDDAIHANSDVVLENGLTGVGDVIINGGNLTLYSNDDGIRADKVLTINGGEIIILQSYEGLEGNIININDGTIQIKASDDGINAATGTNNNSINIVGGLLYLDASGDGIDSNDYVTMSGGIVLLLGPSNGGNGVLDFDRGFSFSGGLLLAIGCSGMNQKPTATNGNTVKTSNLSTTTNSYLCVSVNNEITAVLKITKSKMNYCVLAYNNTTYNNATVIVKSSNDLTLVNNLYYVK